MSRTRGLASWTTSWSDGASTLTKPASPDVQRTHYRELDGRGRAILARYSGAPSDLIEVLTSYDPLDQPLRVRETRLSGNATGRLKAFLAEYREAWRSFKAGARDAAFPEGTYGMRVWCGVACASSA